MNSELQESVIDAKCEQIAKILNEEIIKEIKECLEKGMYHTSESGALIIGSSDKL